MRNQSAYSRSRLTQYREWSKKFAIQFNQEIFWILLIHFKKDSFYSEDNTAIFNSNSLHDMTFLSLTKLFAGETIFDLLNPNKVILLNVEVCPFEDRNALDVYSMKTDLGNVVSQKCPLFSISWWSISIFSNQFQKNSETVLNTLKIRNFGKQIKLKIFLDVKYSWVRTVGLAFFSGGTQKLNWRKELLRDFYKKVPFLA